METVEVVQFSLASLALAISVVAALYAAQVSREVSSSDYASSELVKLETAKLLASLRSIATKGTQAWSGEDVDLTYERQSINEFINSPTAFAYYAWVGLKSDQASKCVSEEWRLLFQHLSEMSYSKDPQQYVWLAVKVEALFDSLGEGDLKIIVEFNSDLINGIANAKQGRAGAPILDGLHGMQQERKAQEDEDHKLAMPRLACLKDLGVVDPDVDLHLSMLKQDINGIKVALKRGAKVNSSIPEVLVRYEAQLANFDQGEHQC